MLELNEKLLTRNYIRQDQVESVKSNSLFTLHLSNIQILLLSFHIPSESGSR